MNLTLPTPSSSRHSFGPFGHIEHIGSWLNALGTPKIRPNRLGNSTLSRIQPVGQKIARNEIVEVQQPLGITIECLAGSIWVTLDGDSRDVVLGTGQIFIVDRPQRTLIQALEAAHIRLIEPIGVQ